MYTEIAIVKGELCEKASMTWFGICGNTRHCKDHESHGRMQLMELGTHVEGNTCVFAISNVLGLRICLKVNWKPKCLLRIRLKLNATFLRSFATTHDSSEGICYDTIMHYYQSVKPLLTSNAKFYSCCWTYTLCVSHSLRPIIFLIQSSFGSFIFWYLCD